jgi:hypothetical protein
MLIDLHRMLFTRLALLLLGSALSLSAGAQVFKCVDGSGKTAYQSQPCPKETRSSQIDVRSVSSLPAWSANASAADFRQAVVSSCLAQGERTSPPLAHSASEQGRKFRDFCQCTGDGAMAQIEKVKELAIRRDKAGMEQLGMQVGMSCASRLR